MSGSTRNRSGAAKTREDLAPDRMVPVAERPPAGNAVGPERSPSQHFVVAAEEHLRVLPVGEGPETRIRMETRRRPLPHVADQLLDTRCRRTRRVRADARWTEMALTEIGKFLVCGHVPPREPS